MKIDFQGAMEEAVEVEPVSSNEAWSEFQLSDGGVLAFRDIMVSIHRLVGKTNPDGSPIYCFRTQRVVRLKGVKGDN